jgi:hypothetical protein
MKRNLQWILTKLGTYLVLKRIWNPIDFLGQNFRRGDTSHFALPLFTFYTRQHIKIDIYLINDLYHLVIQTPLSNVRGPSNYIIHLVAGGNSVYHIPHFGNSKKKNTHHLFCFFFSEIKWWQLNIWANFKVQGP